MLKICDQKMSHGGEGGGKVPKKCIIWMTRKEAYKKVIKTCIYLKKIVLWNLNVYNEGKTVTGQLQSPHEPYLLLSSRRYGVFIKLKLNLNRIFWDGSEPPDQNSGN